MEAKLICPGPFEQVSAPEKKTSGHTKAKAPIISLREPGRLRVAHVMSLFGVSHSTFYAGVKKGRYPAPDGKDGKLPYWKTQTIRQFLLI